MHRPTAPHRALGFDSGSPVSFSHVVRPRDGLDEVVLGTQTAVGSELEGGSGKEWAFRQDDLLK